MLKEKIYLGSISSFDLNFKRKIEGIWLDYSLVGVSRVILSEVNDEWNIDSNDDDASGVFDWSIAGYPSRMKVTAGGQSLTPGVYNCYFKLYFSGVSGYKRWGEVLQIEVI